jgi:hypothetical protein
MLLLLLSWILLLPAAWIVGSTIAGREIEDRFVPSSVFGLFTLASVTLAVSVVFPLQPPAGIVSLLIPPILCLIFRRPKELPPVRWKLLAAILAATAANVSGPVSHSDTGLYHYQLMRWISDFGAVQGLGLLHYRLGFSSSWLSASAALDFPPWAGRAATIWNGLLFALMIYHFLVILARKQRTSSDLVLLFGYPLLLCMTGVLRMQVSPSPNLPAAAGVLLTGWLLSAGQRGPALLLAGTVFAVKASTAPALAVAAVLGRRKAVPLAAAVVLAAPLIVANYTTTGCPLFPSTLLCTEGPATVGKAKAAEVAHETVMWARYGGPWPDKAEYASLDWLPGWLTQPFHLLLVLVVAFALRRSALDAPLVLGLAGCAYVFVTAPDFRFAFGYSALLLGWAGTGWKDQAGSRRWAPLVICLILLDAAAHEAGYWLLGQGPTARPGWSRLVVPAPLTEGELSREVQVNDVRFRMPRADKCWSIEIPCTPYEPVPTLRLCKPEAGPRGGFCR